MSPLTIPIEAAVGLALLVGGLLGAAAAWLIRPRYVLWRDRRRRQQLLDSMSVECLREVAIADGLGGHLHVDTLLLTPRGVVMLDFWDVLGNVFGSDPMTHWTVTRATHRHTFPNPQAALYDRVAAVRVIVGDVPVEGRIVFADSAQFPKGMPRFTVLESKLSTEFFFGERHLAERAVEPWRQGWEALKAAAKPSPRPEGSL